MKKGIVIIISILLGVAFFIDGQQPSKNKANKRFSDGEYAYVQGKFQKSKTAFERAMRLYKGNDDDEFIIASSLCALALINKGKHKEAFYVFKDAEEIYEQKDRKVSMAAAATLKLCLGKYHLAFQEQDVAVPLVEEAVEIAEADPTEVLPYIQAETNETLGKVYYQKGEFTKAEKYYQKAVELGEKVTEEQGITYKPLGDTKLKLGEIYNKTLNAEDASQQFKDLLEQVDELFSNPAKKSELLTKVGKNSFRQTDYDTTEHYIQQVLQKPELLTPEQRAESEFIMSTVKLNQKDFTSALDFNGNVIEFWNDAGNKNPAKLYEALMQFGNIFQKVDTSGLAEYWYGKLGLAGYSDAASELERYDQQAFNFSDDQDKTRNYNMALVFYERAEELIGKLDAKSQDAALIDIHLAKGKLFLAATVFNKAETEYISCLEIMTRTYTEKNSLRAEAYRGQGDALIGLGRIDEALKSINNSLTESKQNSTIESIDIPDTSQLLFPYEFFYAMGLKGEVLRLIYDQDRQVDKLEKSLKAFDETRILTSVLRKSHRNEGAKYTLSELAQRFGQQAVLTCERLYKEDPKEQYMEASFIYAERAKANTLLEYIHDLKARKIAGVPDSIIRQENKLKIQVSYYEKEIFYEKKRGKYKDTLKLKNLRTKLNEAKISHSNAIRTMEKDFPSYHKLKYDYNTANLTQIRSALKENEVIVQYVLMDTSVGIFLLDEHHLKFKMVKSDQPITKDIKRFLRAITKSQMKPFCKHGYRLHQILLEPIKEEIVGKKLIIIPDLELNYLPFELLITENFVDNGKTNWGTDYLHYAVQDYVMCYNYSATLFAEGRGKRSTIHKKNFGAWAPNFKLIDSLSKVSDLHQDRYSKIQLEPLIYAAKEVKDLGKLCNGDYVTGYTKESQFKKVAKDYGVLHFATHGILDNRNPMYSKLAFLPDEEEDGFLHTYELYNMELDAEIVTLSACNSGIGRIRKGEGAMSIARGFAYAGCPNIIMSLWPVSDQATKVIMDNFYTNLLKGMDKDKALQQAKVDYLKTYKDKSASPVLWGAFVVVGNPDQVVSLARQNTQIGSFWWWLIAGVIFVILVGVIGYFILSARRR
ncbi:MAG: CHAT domain-containing protein [Saprospiraceae bacterium]|nr:CHAT domain-containing protein [Saprospiraceae bacterium]